MLLEMPQRGDRIEVAFRIGLEIFATVLFPVWRQVLTIRRAKVTLHQQIKFPTERERITGVVLKIGLIALHVYDSVLHLQSFVLLLSELSAFCLKFVKLARIDVCSLMRCIWSKVTQRQFDALHFFDDFLVFFIKGDIFKPFLSGLAVLECDRTVRLVRTLHLNDDCLFGICDDVAVVRFIVELAGSQTPRRQCFDRTFKRRSDVNLMVWVAFHRRLLDRRTYKVDQRIDDVYLSSSFSSEDKEKRIKILFLVINQWLKILRSNTVWYHGTRNSHHFRRSN